MEMAVTCSHVAFGLGKTNERKQWLAFIDTTIFVLLG